MLKLTRIIESLLEKVFHNWIKQIKKHVNYKVRMLNNFSVFKLIFTIFLLIKKMKNRKILKQT